MHYIKVSVVEELVKKTIHTVSSFAIENEAEYDSEQGALEGRIEEITTPILNEFIGKIVVHEADKSGGRPNIKQILIESQVCLW